MDHQDKGIKVPLLFSHTQTRQEVMTASCSPCYSSGRGRVTKKPPETAPNPAWVGSGRPSGTGTTMQSLPEGHRGRESGKEYSGQKNSTCRQARIYPEDKDAPLKDSMLASSRADRAFRNHSSSGGH